MGIDFVLNTPAHLNLNYCDIIKSLGENYGKSNKAK